MSSLAPREKAVLEGLFGMSGGYVLDFSDATIGTFFGELDIDIHSDKYQRNGSSKAKKLREFWRLESDDVVGASILGMIDHLLVTREVIESQVLWQETEDSKTRKQKEDALIARAKAIAGRLWSGDVNLQHLKESTKPFDDEQMAKQINRIEKSISDDPALAIGTAKELVETCCKTILDASGETNYDRLDLIKLVKHTMKHLQLMPDDIPDAAKGAKTIKAVLGNLATISQGMAELRNLYGTGHGKHANHKRLPPRHARLAVGAATTLASFLFETHAARNDDGVGARGEA
jgi:hypothetical protein